jgi:hypothetical protein
MTEQQERTEDQDEDPGHEHEDLATSETNGHVHFPDPPSPPLPTQKRTRRSRIVSSEAPRPSGGKGTGRTAMEVWPELLAECKSKGESIYNLSVRVVCDDPPPSRPIGNAFSANVLLGDRSTSPGDRLYQYVRDNYHLTWAKGPCVYDIQFIWRNSGGYARRGFLQLPDPEEIIALRQNARRMGVYEGAPPEAPPRQPAWDQPPQYAPAPPSYAQPPRWEEPHSQQQQQPPWRSSGPIEAEQLRAELQRERENNARLQGQMSEILQAVREGRTLPAIATAPTQPAASTQQQPVDLDGVVMRILDRMGVKPGLGAPLPAPAPAAPAIQMSETEAVVMRVLGALGIKAGVTPGVGVGAPPTTSRTELETAVDSFDRMVSNIQRVRGVRRKLDEIFSDSPGDASAEIVSDVSKEDGTGKLPFDAVEIPQVKWSDGRPVMFAASRETGKLDPTGAFFSNPVVIEKMSEGFSRFMGVLGNVVQAAVKAQTPQAAAEVVEEIPTDAQEVAGGIGGGWTGMG